MEVALEDDIGTLADGENEMADANWYFALNVEDVDDESVVEATVDGTSIAIYKLRGKVYATSNICTHGQAFLSEGFIDDETIECPLHQGRFHIPTGAPCGAPVTTPIRTYPTKVSDGKVFVSIPGT